MSMNSNARVAPAEYNLTDCEVSYRVCAWSCLLAHCCRRWVCVCVVCEPSLSEQDKHSIPSNPNLSNSTSSGLSRHLARPHPVSFPTSSIRQLQNPNEFEWQWQSFQLTELSVHLPLLSGEPTTENQIHPRDTPPPHLSPTMPPTFGAFGAFAFFGRQMHPLRHTNERQWLIYALLHPL